jgi:murein DD-endopeptidase MepM/ murein hydrolase activator NlpD
MAHLRQGSLRVRPGESVQTGQQLADVGNSGNSTGPHCHVEVLDGAPDLSLLGTPAFCACGTPFGFTDVVRERGGTSKLLHRVIPRRGDVLSSVK